MSLDTAHDTYTHDTLIVAKLVSTGSNTLQGLFLLPFQLLAVITQLSNRSRSEYKVFHGATRITATVRQRTE